MKVDLLSPGELDPELISQWRHIQLHNSALKSPYFLPEFTRLTAAARQEVGRDSQGDVCVALLHSNGKVVGFFPFLRTRSLAGVIARPIAGSFTDFQGLIVDPGFELALGIDPQTLIRQCGIDQWYFDHLLASQAYFQPFHSQIAPSATIDLSSGFAAYLAERQRVSKSRFKDMQRLRRKLESDIGPVRFEAHCPDPAVLEQLLDWKSQQFIRTGLKDPIALPWARPWLRRIHATQTEGFAGMLSVLYAGDHLVAAHMGMCSGSVFHYWLPSYDHRFKRFSPGFLLLLAILEEAAGRGLATVDLGKGSDAYKALFSNGFTPVAEGCIAQPSLQWQLTRRGRQLKQTLKAVVRRFRGQWGMGHS